MSVQILDVQPVGVKQGKLSSKYFFTVKMRVKEGDKIATRTRQIPKGYRSAKTAQRKMYGFVQQMRDELCSG